MKKSFLISRRCLSPVVAMALAFPTSAFAETGPAAKAETTTQADPGKVEPNVIVFDGNREVKLDLVTLTPSSYVINAEVSGFTLGQALPLTVSTYVSGPKPVEINRAISQLVLGKATDALITIAPIVSRHKVTSKISGNYWIPSVRIAIIANAMNGGTEKVNSLGTDLAQVTGAQGRDPVMSLAQVLLMPASTKVDERVAAFSSLLKDPKTPLEICAYASYFRGNYLKTMHRNAEALESYLSVSCLYPAGGMVLNGAAEMKAADILNNQKRRFEAISLLTSATHGTRQTTVGNEVDQRLKSLR